MHGQRWITIANNVGNYFAKRYIDNKYNLKRDYWKAKVGAAVVDAIRSQPPLNFECHNNRYPSLLDCFYTLHTREGVWFQDDARLQYEAMIKLRDLGDNPPRGVPYTKEEILGIAIKGKLRGYIAGRGRQLAGMGKSKVFGLQSRGTYMQPQIDHMLRKRKRNKRLVEATRETKATRRELNKAVSVLRTNRYWDELVS
ncbi:hypothetical protein Tco_0668302 [Tanacetum coccineum]